MEVHAHTHTARKKWTHYFWEFLMLFLAVTLGFFVENKREHIIENKRAKIMAISMIEDLYADTLEMTKAESTLRNVIDAADAAMAELDKATGKRNDSILMLFGAERIHQYDFFDPTTGTYDQVKNSGSLRYFKASISKKMVQYETLRNITVKISNYLMTYRNEQLTPFLRQVANIRWIKSVSRDRSYQYDGEIFQRKLTESQEEEWYSHLENVKRSYLWINGKMVRLRSAAIELVAVLKHEYHLK